MCGGSGGGGKRSPLRHQANNHFKRERVGTLYYYLTSFSEAFVFAWIVERFPEKLLNASSICRYTVCTYREEMTERVWKPLLHGKYRKRQAEDQILIWSVSDVKGFFFPLDFPTTSVTFCGVSGGKKSFSLYTALICFSKISVREQSNSICPYK